MASKFSKSYSNYILRSKPIASNNGSIFENDLLTYGEPYNYVNGNLTTRTEGGFTFITNTSPSEKKEYNNGDFSDRYTLGDILSVTNNNTGTTTNQNQILVQTAIEPTYINLKKTYSDITKFSYFGSTNMLIQSAIEDIINNFPSSLYVSNTSPLIGNMLNLPISGLTNPFNIDLSNYTYDRVTLGYNLKIMATSYMDYVISTGSAEIAIITGFTGTTTNLYFELNNTININSSFHIKPSIKKQDEFFNGLDDLQSTLLNRNSKNKYTATFKIPEETENGITFTYKNFTWPTIYGDNYNLDVTSMDYVLYLQELIAASNYVDENYSDNIYRMLTHDSLKNMDTTYERMLDQNLLDEYIAGGTKFQKILRIYGRQYDEIKKYIEGISFTTNISYDKIDNLPDTYLHGKLNSLGWETIALENVIPQTGKTSSNLFAGMTGNLTTKDVGTELNRRLILTSKDIWKAKGTRKSIRKIFGMFGIDESTYQIREYIQKVDNYITGNTLVNISQLNQDLRSVEIENLFGSSNIITEDILYTGINVGTFVKPPSGSTEYIISGDTGYAKGVEYGEIFPITGNTYGYPKTRPNSNSYYFQQMGGWYRETGGIHVDSSGKTYVTDISTGNNPHAGYGNYDYGADYVDQFKNLFKTDINQQGNYPTIDLAGYTGKGFNISNPPTVENSKINWIGKQKTLNLLNILTDDYGTPIVDDNGNFIYINDDNEQFNSNDGKLTINLKNFVIGIDGDRLLELSGLKNITKEEAFNSIKSLILPYLEQIIPASTIFDFVFIDKINPKWVLIDKTCQRTGDTQNYNGQSILTYKNFNYFDETSTGYTTELTDQIIRDFGDYFTFNTDNGIIGFGREITFIGDDGTCQRDTSGLWITYENLFNTLTI